jgi:hypothetical protein
VVYGKVERCGTRAGLANEPGAPQVQDPSGKCEQVPARGWYRRGAARHRAPFDEFVEGAGVLAQAGRVPGLPGP